MKVITRETIENNNKFILKWGLKPTDANGKYVPGILQQQDANQFLEIVENAPTIINDARFFKMRAIEEDISYLRVNARFQSMRQLSGDDAGKQIKDLDDVEETVPEFSRSILKAEPMTMFTKTPKTFIKENIEGEGFLRHIETILGEQSAYAAEIAGMYGKIKTVSPSTDAVDHIDGFLKQLYDIKDAYDALDNPSARSPRGVFTDIDAYSGASIVKQLKSMITQFSKQKGKKSNAIIYVSSLFEGLLTEEADQRPTEKGDNLYFEGGQLKLWGVPIKQADILDNPENGYSEHVLLANPDSLIFGFLSEFEAENEYQMKQKAYLSSLDVYFTVLLLLNKDALCAKILYTAPSTP